MRKSIMILSLAAVALAGCGDDDDAASRQMSAPAVSAPETTSSPGGSAPTAGTTTDPSVPPADQAVQPAPTGSTAQETSDNPPNELTKEEERNNMPQPGSVHSYNTPVRDETDQTSGK